jgi:hypothetical protein
MEQIATRLRALEPEADQQREQRSDRAAVRGRRPQPRPARPRHRLDEDQQMKAGMAFHRAAGLAWAPQLLRRGNGMGPLAAGLATGA